MHSNQEVILRGRGRGRCIGTLKINGMTLIPKLSGVVIHQIPASQFSDFANRLVPTG